jgi:hypothetical protein
VAWERGSCVAAAAAAAATTADCFSGEVARILALVHARVRLGVTGLCVSVDGAIEKRSGERTHTAFHLLPTSSLRIPGIDSSALVSSAALTSGNPRALSAASAARAASSSSLYEPIYLR